MELGSCLGQQKKLKEIINWLKKKKKRTIRKDELIAVLMGKQWPSQNQMFNLTNNQVNNGLFAPIPQSAPQSVFLPNNRRQQQQQTSRQQHQPTPPPPPPPPPQNQQSQRNSLNSSISQTNSPINNLNSVENVNSEPNAVETNSDLATFREALIMHSKYTWF